MRIHVLSDLHTEFTPIEIPPVEADLTVLAGDIAEGDDGVHWASRHLATRPVLYVVGNHEPYHGTLAGTYERLRDATCQPGCTHIRILQNEECVIGDVAFLGATLWTNMGLFGASRRREAIESARRHVRHYRVVQVSDLAGRTRALDPIDTIGEYRRSIAWLKARIVFHRRHGRKTCVITHHAPARASLSPLYADNLLSACATNTLDEWIRRAGPDLWIHGHTHAPMDYRLGRTRVLCNARGYANEPHAPGAAVFDPGRVVELP